MRIALFTLRAALATLGLCALLLPRSAEAQWVQKGEQFYLPAPHNWEFRRSYRSVDRLFNAFDNAHNALSETLWHSPDAPVERLEQEEFAFIVKDLLVHPPRLPLVEEAIGPGYAKLVPEAKMVFEWAHLLHRQIYDVYADDRVADKDAAVDELLRYYRSRPDLAFSTRPKTMALMESRPYSLAFRQKYPKFNGLIWAYHWLQVGLYEPLILGRTAEERQAGVTAAVARFWSMLEDAPAKMPTMMPMTPAVAPEFTRRHPEAAAVFDNLHAMHDVISDILVSPVVPRKEKRAAILEALARYQDDTTEAMTLDEWVEMSQEMGLDNMGGPAVAILPPPPRGEAMGEMDHAAGAARDAGGAMEGEAGAMQHEAGAMQHDGAKPNRRPAGRPERGMEEQRGGGALSLADLESALAAGGVKVEQAGTIRQPFWSVATTLYWIHGARAPNAALHVNIYPTAEAARTDAAKITSAGAVGTTMPKWVAPPHFFRAGNDLIVLLADPARDAELVRAVQRAMEGLGGALVMPGER